MKSRITKGKSCTLAMVLGVVSSRNFRISSSVVPGALLVFFTQRNPPPPIQNLCQEILSFEVPVRNIKIKHIVNDNKNASKKYNLHLMLLFKTLRCQGLR